jgi:maltose alpha-D-glucosyltransferase/alpha-amylase
MQWTEERHGGFSRAEEVVRPVIDDEEYGYQKVNVADMRRDPNSLLSWTARMIKTRRECPEISWGQFEILETSVPHVLALRYDWRNTSLLVLHNFSRDNYSVNFKVGAPGGELLTDAINQSSSEGSKTGQHTIDMDGYGYRWFRVGAEDNALNRTER